MAAFINDTSNAGGGYTYTDHIEDVKREILDSFTAIVLKKDHGDFWEASTNQWDLLKVVKDGKFLFEIHLESQHSLSVNDLRAMVSAPILSPIIYGIPTYIYDIKYDRIVESLTGEVSPRYTDASNQQRKIMAYRYSAIMECSEPFKISRPITLVQAGPDWMINQYRKHMVVLKNIGG